MLPGRRVDRRVTVRRVLPGTLLVAALFVTGLAHHNMDTRLKLDRGGVFVPDASHVRASTLGFDALLSDYYWLLAVQLVGEDGGRGKLGRGALARLVDHVREAQCCNLSLFLW